MIAVFVAAFAAERPLWQLPLLVPLVAAAVVDGRLCATSGACGSCSRSSS